MDKKVEVRKTSLNKTNFNVVVDRNFKTFTQPEEPALESQIDLFFNLYENLYLEIPIEGQFKSHRFLVERSSELVTIEADQTNIQPLLDEISQLREQLLETNRQLLELRLNRTRPN